MQPEDTQFNAANPDLNNLGNGLLVTRNEATTRMIEEAVRPYGISIQSCPDSGSCLKAIGRRRFEVVFIDFSSREDAQIAIEHIRSSASTRNAVIIAIARDAAEAKRAFQAGATFELQEPLSNFTLRKLLRAAYGLILRERRRYFRCYVDAPVAISRDGYIAGSGKLVNISESGLCLIVPFRLSTGNRVGIELRLPASPFNMAAECEVLWCDASNRCGLKFVKVGAGLRTELQHWLANRLDAALASIGEIPSQANSGLLAG